MCRVYSKINKLIHFYFNGYGYDNGYGMYIYTYLLKVINYLPQ